MNALICPTKIGPLVIAENGRAITCLHFPGEPVPSGYVYKDTDLLNEAALQLQGYLTGTLKTFSVPLEPSGTAFMQKVWSSLMQIPYGETRSYKDIAVSIGNPRACRAVGQANNRNPIAIFIPCHRVIGANGQLIGYGGGLHIKEYLLGLESNNT